MKTYIILIAGVILSLGCARVRVEAPKEPIKVDISMRLDIYQHVQKDIDVIESIVSGSKEKPKAGNSSSLNYFIATAYAQEALAPEVEEAALRRKDRRSELISWEEKGAVGENMSGLVEIRNPAGATDALGQLVKSENEDRMIIYQAVAEKNGTSVEEVQKLYAKRLQEDAPSGTPIEAVNASGDYEWKIK
jgi:uncharacterized protein YdbL (DUF1318 family)